MGQLQGKVAIVTGGASGIGAASAETLAQEGATVVVADIDEAGGEAVVRRIAGAGGQAVFLRHDVTSEARWVEVVADITDPDFDAAAVMVEEAVRRYGAIDILPRCTHPACHAETAQVRASADAQTSNQSVSPRLVLPSNVLIL